MANKDLWIYVNSTGQKVKTKNLSLNQNSTNNTIHFVITEYCDVVRASFRLPNGKVYPSQGLTYKGKYQITEDDQNDIILINNADNLFEYTLQIPLNVTKGFILSNSARLSVAISCYNYVGEELSEILTVANTSIIMNRSDISTVTDDSVTMDELNNLWTSINSQIKINEEQNNTISALATNLSKETSDRISADNNLQEQITSNDNDISNLTSRMNSAESSITYLAADISLEEISDNNLLIHLKNNSGNQIGSPITINMSRDKLISIIGNASSSLSGIMSTQDKINLDTLTALLSDDDSNDIVNTIAEILRIFQNYPEGVGIFELLSSKADKSNTYTKEETHALIDSTMAGEANLINYYTKNETNTLLDLKANKSETYTKTETDNLLSSKADKKDVSEVDIDLEGTGTIVSIPENSTGYGTIEKLGGKSYKSKNLITNPNSTTKTSYNVTFTPQGDGTYRTSGTATGRAQYIVQTVTLTAGTYTLRDFGYSYNNNIGIYGQLVGTQTYFDLVGTTTGYKTFTLSESRDVVFNIDVRSNIDTSGYVFKPMLVEGSTPPTEFSQGFEGIKIEYPTNVKSVTGNICNYDEFLANQYTIANDGSYTSDNTRGCTNYLEIKSKEYKVSFDTQVVFISVAYYDENKTYMSRSIANDSKELNLSIPSNAKYLRFSFQYQYATPLSTTILNNIKPILSYVSQNLPQTNVINYVSNELQTKHSWTQENASKWLGLGVGNDSNIIDYANKKGIVKYGIVDLGTLSYSKVSAFISEKYYFSAVLSNAKLAASPTSLVNAICSNYSLKSGNELYIEAPDNSIAIPYDNHIVMIIDNNYTDADTFKNAMQGVMLIYELATPIEIDLSSLETEEHFECESNGSIIHDNLANYKYSFPVSLKGQVELNFEHDKEQQRDIDSLKKEIDLKANNSELSNVAKGLNKPLYNLGAFDTISGNVITRQTGYVDLGTFGWGVAMLNAYNGQCTQMNINLPNTSTEATSFVSNILIPDGTFNPALYHAIISSTNIYFNIPLQTSTDNAIAYTLNLGIQIQYKLATSYTEEIIEGQPLITLDQQGSQWLRSEWEKGLNLSEIKVGYNFDFSNGAITFIGGTDRSISNFIEYNGQNITVSGMKNNIWSVFACYDANFNYLDRSGGGFATIKSLKSEIIIPSNTKYVLFVYYAQTSEEVVNTDLMINYGDHAYPYQPYNSKAHITNYEADFLKEEFNKSANLFDKDNVVAGDINSTNGVLTNTTGFMASDYIEIKPNTTYSNNLKIKSFSSTGLAFYDSNKNYISGIINNSSAYNKFTTPSNAKYLRLSIDESYSQPYDDINNVMLNEGSTALPYQPYNGSIVREKQIEELKNEINSLKERIAKLESK